jgi:outer membrane protein assembly factor BamB
LLCVVGLATALSACGDDGGDDDDGDGRGPASDAAPPRDDAAARDADTAGDTGAGGSGSTGPSIWTHLGYDARSNYFNPNETAITVENAATLTQKWAFTVSGYPAGSAAVADGTVFALATGGLYAIELASGDEVWQRSELAGQSSVTYDDGFLYVHTQGAELYKLRADDGETVWGPVKTYDHPAADGTSSPVVADGKVMVGHSTAAEITRVGQMEARGGVFAADTETGTELWHYFTVELPENGAMVWSTVSVDLEAGVVYASSGNNYNIAGTNSDAIHAIDFDSGARLWVKQVREGDTWVLGGGTGRDTDFGANPIIADFEGQKLVAAGDKGSSFWALDRVDGTILWSRTDLSSSHGPATGGVLNNGAFDGKYFYVTSNQPPGLAVLHALDPATGEDAWAPAMLDKITWGMPTVANGVLFVPVGDDLRIYDAHAGDLLHTINTGGTIAAGGAAIVDGHVIVKSGLQYPLDSSVVNNNQIYCYGLP